MRIISGKFKGKVLSEFLLEGTRPTADMVREALFDKIGFAVFDCLFLDLFAGTGAVGIEALSRSAKNCVFVEKNKDALKILTKNLASINATNFEICNCDYFVALQDFKQKQKQFDIIFLDPPYKADFAEIAIDYIFTNNLISKNGLIVWEHDESKLEYINSKFVDAKTKKYGKKYLTYLNIK